MERQKILNPLTGRMVYADGVVAKSIPKMKKKVSVLEGAIKRTGTTKIAEKKEAVGKLSGAIKRTLAKKPEPKKVYGWEDLPDDIKVKISGIMKKDSIDKIGRENMIKELNNVFVLVEAYLTYSDDVVNKKVMEEIISKYSKLTDFELYDFLYRGGIKKEAIDFYNLGVLDQRLEDSRYYYYNDKRHREERDINGKLTPAELKSLPDDKGDNLEFKKYYNLGLKEGNKVNLQLYYQIIIENDDAKRPKEYYVLVNPLSAGESVGKFLKLYVKENSEFLENDNVNHIIRYKDFAKGKKAKKYNFTPQDVKDYIRKKGLKINDDGIVTSLDTGIYRGEMGVESYNRLISHGIGASEYYLNRYEKHPNKSWISPHIRELSLKIKDTLEYINKNNKKLMDRYMKDIIYGRV